MNQADFAGLYDGNSGSDTLALSGGVTIPGAGVTLSNIDFTITV